LFRSCGRIGAALENCLPENYSLDKRILQGAAMARVLTRTAFAATIAILFALTGCASGTNVSASDSGDYVVLTTDFTSAELSSQVLAEGDLALAGSCMAIDGGDRVLLGVFPASTTVTDEGSVEFADGVRWDLGDPIRAGGGAIFFEDLGASIKALVPPDCVTDEVFFIAEHD
jgi:hypothetical protein